VIAISEIFGPTIQGEGQFIGKPTVFVRTGGCDYACSWCDTKYAVDESNRPRWTDMSATEVFHEVSVLTNGLPIMITLSGGNPATQDLREFLLVAGANKYPVMLETQGSISAPWFDLLDYITISPKGPSSGQVTEYSTVEECIHAFTGITVSPDFSTEYRLRGSSRWFLKVVVSDREDFEYAVSVSAWFGHHCDVFLSPCFLVGEGDPVEQSIRKMLEVFEWVKESGLYNLRVLPQLHTYLWGSKRGV